GSPSSRSGRRTMRLRPSESGSPVLDAPGGPRRRRSASGGRGASWAGRVPRPARGRWPRGGTAHPRDRCRSTRPAAAIGSGPGRSRRRSSMGAPSESEILADVARLLGDFGGRQYSGAIGPETRFFGDLGLASIDAVVLGEALEHHYGRPLPFGDLM